MNKTASDNLSYAIGWAPFLGVRVDLSARPLIPRPETEYWTGEAIKLMKQGPAEPRILDIFCGSGCIGLAVLKHVRGSRVDFADIEPGYFPGIRKSLRSNRIDPRRARLVRSDVFKNLGARKYDLILANPPYIAARGRYVQKSVLEQEPHQALFAGADGLLYIKKLLREARKHLRPGGALIFEFDSPQKSKIDALGHRLGWSSTFFRDHYGRWRWAVLSRRS